MLVIRANASDSSTTATESQLSDDLFGTSGDTMNIKSQFALCSDGNLLFEPLTTNSLVGTDGVYTISLPNTTVNGISDGIIKDAMTNQAAKDLGAPLNTIADYVILCLPPGTSGGWIAYAYINSWLLFIMIIGVGIHRLNFTKLVSHHPNVIVIPFKYISDQIFQDTISTWHIRVKEAKNMAINLA